MERWDGSGYPQNRLGSDISPIAQIVGIAKELDRLSAETASETPFDDAYRTLVAQSGTLWSPELIEVLKESKTKCRAVYTKYIHYTMTLPKTIPLVEKRKNRVMGLRYRPMVSDTAGTVAAYEAIPWFGGISDRPGETETAGDIAPILARKNLVTDITMYFLYEAADTVLRMENCKLDLRGVLLQVLPDFYLQGSQLQRINQLFKDQPIPREKLLLTVPMDILLGGKKSTLDVVERYLRNGICLMVDGYDPGKLPYQELKAMGFTYLRIDPALHLKQETANVLYNLRKEGFVLIGGGGDTHDTLAWQIACGMAFTGGTLTGVPVSEDELIRDCLSKEK
jgi:EAL domain-containing protein (putative c-di-GMP-specific phosphodiesterase class I)